MSTIKIEFDCEDKTAVTAVTAMTLSLLGAKNLEKIKEMPVTDAEEVVAPKPAAKPRSSRAKAKPEPEPEEEEDDEFETGQEGEGDFEEEETEDDDITEDTLRELSAKKIGKHKDAIIAELAKFKVKGWANLPEEHYAHMQAFLTKLK